MRTRIICLIIVSVLAPSAAARAQSAAQGVVSRYLDSVTGVALEEAIARALRAEPSLQAARSDVETARGMRVQAGLRPNPMVAFSQLEEPAGSDRQTRVEIAWPLDLFRKSGRVDVADREIRAAELEIADRERLLAADVRSQYGEVAAAISDLAVLGSLIESTAEQHALIAARVEQGAAAPLDRDILTVELRQLQIDAALASGVVERAMVDLKRLLGMPADAPLTIRDSLERIVARNPEAGALLDTVTAGARTDVQAAVARVDVATADIERARKEARFDVSLSGMYMRMDAGFPQRAFGMTGNVERVRAQFNYVALGATVTLPWLDRKQGEIAAARARLNGAEAEHRAVALTAEAEVAAARARHSHARQALAAYTSDLRTMALRNASVVSQSYELGRATLLDVIVERRRYLEVERGFVRVLKETYEAQEALRRAQGEAR